MPSKRVVVAVMEGRMLPSSIPAFTLRETYSGNSTADSEVEKNFSTTSLPAPRTHPPQALRNFARSSISGSRAALWITVSPAAPTAAIITFSVAPTDG